MAKSFRFARSDIDSLINPEFGPDPYFDLEKATIGLPYDSDSLARQHIEYMFRFCWPLMASFRKVLVGQRDMTTYTAVGRFAVGDRDFRSDGSLRLGFGHVFFSSFPGTGKSLLAKVPALVLGGTSSRFQGMAGTLPADYTGNRLIQIDEKTGKRIFELVPGPGFSHIQLLDEFFRSDARTQSGALEALGEGTITIFGKTHQVDPFALITGNPIESRGVYPASEAFLDRIMFKILGRRFSAQEGAEILRRTGSYHTATFKKLCDTEQVKEIQEFFHKNIYVSDGIEKKIGRFMEITNDPHGFGFLEALKTEFGGPIILGGLSGRGICHWEGAAKVLAAFRYRNYVTLDDLRKLLFPILRHRLIFAPNVLRLFAYLWKFNDTNEACDRIIEMLIKEAW